MATFPAIEPSTRSYDITGELPMVEESAWPAGSVRYRVGSNDLTSVGLSLQLTFDNLSEAEADQIRDHYDIQMGGTIPFNLPAVIFQGQSSPITPVGVRWRYTSPPSFAERKGRRFDAVVPLESMNYTAVEP